MELLEVLIFIIELTNTFLYWRSCFAFPKQCDVLQLTRFLKQGENSEPEQKSKTDVSYVQSYCLFESFPLISFIKLIYMDYVRPAVWRLH